MEYKRWANELIKNSLSKRRVITISGARQCGKTTLTKQISIKKSIYRTLDDTMLLSAAKDSPSDFIKHSEGTMIIDEIQKAPLLLPEIKKVVDINKSYGQFILTGSADVTSLPEVTESLAGRIKNVTLHTLTEGEIRGTTPNFFKNIKAKKIKSQFADCNKEDILKIALRGGYPEIIKFSDKDRKDWHRDYLNTLITRDLKHIANIRRTETLKELVTIVSALSGKYMSANDICSSLQISKNTLTEYISLLEHIYLCKRVPAWTKTDYDKIGKKDKFYFYDTGLMASTLNWHYDNISLNADRYGKLIETMIFKELSVLTSLNSEYSMYQYRDREKREIDFIIEDESNNILAIEVKGGSKVEKDDFKHIVWFQKNIAKDSNVTGIILYSGENTIYFDKNLIAVPIACLWSDYR